jgi:hypothetical protein
MAPQVAITFKGGFKIQEQVYVIIFSMTSYANIALKKAPSIL